jgi:hypothetical protein
MSTAQMVSRGFHRLGLFLAAITLVPVGILSLAFAREYADSAKFVHDVQLKSACARERLSHPNDAKLPNGQPNYYALFALR